MRNTQKHPSPHPWHTLPAEQAIAQLDTSPQGLSADNLKHRLRQYGPNQLPQPASRSWLSRLLAQFNNVLIYVLLVASAITALLNHWIDTAVILAVVLVNAIIGFLQEGKAEQAMNALRQMLAPKATVLRGGVRMQTDAEQIVPGDIVLLDAGDKVPADVRLIKTNNLSIQEAILTGESVAVDKQNSISAQDSALGDRIGMAYSGTLVTTGQATGVVVATGADTEIGRISGLLGKVETLTTPLVAQMAVFSKWLTLLIIVVSAVLLGIANFTSAYSFSELFMVIVGLAVAAIPEGLPAVLTITLAIGVQAMAKKNAIVRRLPAIETLGSVSVICSDKTGTLTRNEMMVATAFANNKTVMVNGEGYAPIGDLQPNLAEADSTTAAAVKQLATAALLCNDAQLHHKDNQWQIAGDPMEGALLAFAHKVLDQPQDLKQKMPRGHEIPFDAAHRYMATLHPIEVADKAGVYIKGAPEQIIAMCSATADQQQQWQQQIELIASQGQRVLAFAYKAFSADKKQIKHDDLATDCQFLGLTGLIDPPRAEAIDAIAECHAAGIQVKMITGDHSKTAAAIGRQIGLRQTDTVLTGADIDKLTDAELNDTVRSCDVFARTTPEHKLRLVSALQAQGLTVAMTGDGVNDAPALKRADAGIAMGQNGTEAAKEAAELVLVDDNFASIVAAIREGRTVYDNLKKVISWTLPTNAGEALTIIVALIAGLTLPVTAIQILWINLVTAVTLGIALAFEPTEENTMQRPPRRRDAPLLSGDLVWHIILVSVLFLAGVFAIHQYAIGQGYSLQLAQTMALNTLVVMEIFHLFFIRNIYSTSLTWQAIKGTKVVWSVVAVIVIAQLLVTYSAPMQKLLGTEAIPLMDGLLVLGCGIALFAIIELEKQLRLTLTARRS